MEDIEESWKDRRIRLQDILSPLYDGLQDSETPKQEFNERIEALKTVCAKELKELLEYVTTTSEQEQLNQSKLKQEGDGHNWQKQATDYLENDHRLVEGDWWGNSSNRKVFTPTERGKAVYEALKSLLESSYLDEWQNENESREKAAFKALSEPHNAGI
jgi:hypothetical protein